MSNPDELAFPSSMPLDCRDAQGCAHGLTKREYIATHIAVGLCACPNYPHDVALGAVAIADRLLEALAGQSK